MAEEHTATSDRHFSGITTALIAEYLQSRLDDDAVAALLASAGESRSLTELMDLTSWSSYSQVRRFLEAIVDRLGDSSLREFSRSAEPRSDMPEFVSLLQSLGSPTALYEALAELGAHFSPLLECSASALSPTEWVCEVRMTPPFEPFRAYCDYTYGLLALVPRVFAFPLAEVMEESCQLRGDLTCRYRVTWDPTDDAQRRAAQLEYQLDLANARIHALHSTVAHLVSDDGLDQVLTRILASAAKTVSAPGYVLVLDNLSLASRPVYAEGMTIGDAERHASDLARTAWAETSRYLVVDIASTHRRYGRLAAVHHEKGGFLPFERSNLEAYARLAATALDSATALEDARRQSRTAHVLLDLSRSLAELESIELIADRVVQAVPEVIDCDRAALLIVEPATSIARFVATYGYPNDVEAVLRGARFPVGRSRASTGLAASIDAGRAPFDLDEHARRYGSVGTATCAIVGGGELVGWLAASVTCDRERLIGSAEVRERLEGLAGQAASAIRNARLLDEIRRQATHDALTGLPNRALILDQVERLLERTRRLGSTPHVFFVDLDGFKEVNDKLGHAAGDELLCTIARRFRGALRTSDTIGRLGGDEFVILVETNADNDAALALAERLLDAARKPVRLGNQVVALSASVGIASGDHATPGDMLRDADVALYGAKGSGKDRLVVHAPSMSTSATRALSPTWITRQTTSTTSTRRDRASTTVLRATGALWRTIGRLVVRLIEVSARPIFRILLCEVKATVAQ